MSGMLRKRHCPVGRSPERRIDREALFPEFLEVMGFPEGLPVPREKRFQGFFSSLLGVKNRLVRERVRIKRHGRFSLPARRSQGGMKAP